MDTGKEFIRLIQEEFRKAKGLAEKAIAQLNDEQLYIKPDKESNDIAIIMRHMAGNMISRWTDFYTTDGEKPDRDRDVEFEDVRLSRQELMDYWQRGWNVLFSVIDDLTEEKITRTIYIRKEPHTVLQAILRQHSHYNYHVGQIVLLAKIIASDKWKTLSIAKGKSKEYNASK
jgi:hypothetical protein